MFLPIGDENPRERTPYVNYALLGANVVAFFWCFPYPSESVLQDWALIPKDWAGRPETLFTSMFLHGSLFHLIGNMLFLWIFGDNIEDRLGHVGYFFFYFACGLAASGLHIASTDLPDVPTLGASGAISGVVGAYALFFPRHRVRCVLWIWFYVTWIHIEAVWWVAIWFLEQIVMASAGTVGIAYLAHIGGFLAGLGIGAVAKYLLIPLAGGARPVAGRVPSEIRDASRRSGRTPVVERPLVFLDADDLGGVVFLDEPEQKYAVLRSTDELTGIGRIAAVAAAVTGEPARAVARRLDATRGVIAKDIGREHADRIQHELRLIGIPALVVPLRAGYVPPPATPVSAAVWTDDGLACTVEGAARTTPWGAAILYLGAKAGGEAFIDIFLTPRARIRVPERAAMRFVDTRSGRERPAALPDLALAILAMRRGGAINDGIRVLAHHGSWGWLKFPNVRDFEDYVLWTYNTLLDSLPILR